MRKPLLFATLCATPFVALFGLAPQTRAQLGAAPSLQHAGPVWQPYSSSESTSESASYSALPDPPDPSPVGRGDQWVPPDMQEHYGRFSRMGVGGGISPLGIGIRGAVILAEGMDLRVETNLFFYDTGRFEINGFNVDANFHMDSINTKFDWYPTKGPWRITPGIMWFNGNRISATLDLVGGTNFTLSGKNYWSATANSTTGATPVTGNVAIGLNPRKPAFTIATGFGKYIPRSPRHWSFPTEFGVSFTGSPSIDVTMAGWVCTNKKQTQCSDIADPTNPVAIQFNNSLNTQLAKWRRDFGKAPIFPIFSGGVMYSFDLPAANR